MYLLNEVENKPTALLFDLLCYGIIRPGTNLGKWKALLMFNIIQDENEKKVLTFLHEYDSDVFKLTLFLFWELKFYIQKNYSLNDINIEELDYYYILDLDSKNYNISSLYNFKIEDKPLNAFFDIDKNLLFWDKWHKFCCSDLNATKKIVYDLKYRELEELISKYIINNYFNINLNSIKENDIKKELTSFLNQLEQEYISIIDKKSFFYNLLDKIQEDYNNINNTFNKIN